MANSAIDLHRMTLPDQMAMRGMWAYDQWGNRGIIRDIEQRKGTKNSLVTMYNPYGDMSSAFGGHWFAKASDLTICFDDRRAWEPEGTPLEDCKPRRQTR